MALNKYRNRALQTAQVIEELIELARQFNEAARRGDDLKRTDEELSFYDALETTEASVRDLGNDTLRQNIVELTKSLRKNVSGDWPVRKTTRARL